MPLIIYRENGKDKWLSCTIRSEWTGTPKIGVGLYETCPFRKHGSVVVGTSGYPSERMAWHDLVNWEGVALPLTYESVFGVLIYGIDAYLKNKPKDYYDSLDFVVTDGQTTYFNYDPQLQRYAGQVRVLGRYRETLGIKRYLRIHGADCAHIDTPTAIQALLAVNEDASSNRNSYPMFLYEVGSDKVIVMEEDGSTHEERLPVEGEE